MMNKTSEGKSYASLLYQSMYTSAEIGTFDDRQNLYEEFDKYDFNFLNPQKQKFSIHDDEDDNDDDSDNDRKRSFLPKLPHKKRKLLAKVSSSH